MTVQTCLCVCVCWYRTVHSLPICHHLFLPDSSSDHHCYRVSSSELGTFHSIIILLH